jgi:hypothetical protein
LRVRRQGQNARLRQNAAAAGGRFDADELFALNLDARDTVVLGERGVDERKIGIQEVENAAIFANHRREEQLAFANHRVFQGAIVSWKHLGIGRRRFQLAQRQPLLREALQKRLGLGVLGHAQHLTK